VTELQFTLLDWGIILCYFALLVYLTWQRDWQDEDEESFLLSGRKMSLTAFVATLVSTWYGGILGVGEFSYQNGLSTWLILGFPFYVFSALFAWLLAGKIRMNKALSLPEAVGNYYGEAAGRFSYIEDPDGTLIEFVNTHKLPIMKKWGWYLNLRKRKKQKPLPDWMLKTLSFNRVSG